MPDSGTKPAEAPGQPVLERGTPQRPLVIGIAGGTGSGKTTVAHKLAHAMPEGRCALIEHDSYYYDQSHLSVDERKAINYDHPSSLESSLLAEQLARIRQGGAIDVPRYAFVTHARLPERPPVQAAPVTIAPGPLGLAGGEGILGVGESPLREQFDIKGLGDTDRDIRLMRRIRRDLEHRGRSFQSVRDQYYATVRPMHLEYVEPSKRWADLIVPEGGDNRVALDVLLGQLGRVAYGTH